MTSARANLAKSSPSQIHSSRWRFTDPVAQSPIYTGTSFRYSSAQRSHVQGVFRQNHVTTVPVRSSYYRALTAPRTLTALVLIGALLRLWAYLADTALYLDEILLSYSILNLPLVDLLTQALPLDQVAPLGFLLVERCSVTIFGHNELALRLFPFVCAIISLILFRRLAERVLTGAGPTVALFAFAIGFPFIRYAVVVKQYELDVMAAILLMLIALNLHEDRTTTIRLLLLGFAGFVVISFSQASVLVMAGLGFALVVEWLRSREQNSLRALLFTVPLWAVASIVAVIIGVRSMTPSTRAFMDDFWAGGFVPLPFRALSALRWFWESVTSIFSDVTLLRYRWPVIFVIVALVGVISLWRRSRWIALVLLSQFIMGIIAAVEQQYPLRGRLALWLLPAVLLAVAAGAEWICARANLLHPIVGAIFLVAILVPPVVALAEAPPPYEIEHHKDLLGYLQKNRRPGDVVYVFPLPTVGVRFYGPRFGLQRSDWIAGVCDRSETRAYLKDLDRFRGASRFWILTGGGRPMRFARSAVLQYLGTIGKKTDSLSLPSPTYGSVTIELYDLSDPTRLSSANAETFPAPPMATDPRPGCRDWVSHWPGE
jgi:hypothetical protein